MNFSEIILIIKEIKNNFSCPQCQQKFTNNSIHLLGTTKYQGSFYIICQNCQTPILLNVFLPHLTITEIERGHKKDFKPISQNDILDMHNFLQSLKGEDLAKFIN